MNKLTFNAALREICNFKHHYNCDPQAVIHALTILFLLEHYSAAEANAFCENNFEGNEPPVNKISLSLYNNQVNTDIELVFNGDSIVVYDDARAQEHLLSLDDALVFVGTLFELKDNQVV
jgi:hypothetical protein